MGHEFTGVVEDTCSDVRIIKRGRVVHRSVRVVRRRLRVLPRRAADSCKHGGFWNSHGVGGGRAEAVRVPLADGTVVAAPVDEDSTLIPSLHTLSDLYGTGYHAAVKAGVNPHTTVTVIGDGAVGLLAVLSAKRLGAEQIILMGRHKDRTDLGREFGATDVVAERGEEGIAMVRGLTGGDGTHVVLEAVDHLPAYEQAYGIVRPRGVISRVCGPQCESALIGFASLFGGNITLTGGPAPARAYIETLMSDIRNGAVDPGRVFDREIALPDVPDGYRAMDSREALKILFRP